MKNAKMVQSFKVVKETQVARFPELANRLGQKRDSVEYIVPVYESSDLTEGFVQQRGDLLATVLNRALDQLAKDQFAENQTNWSFAPSLDSLTLDALAASFVRQTSGRVLTLESAGKLAAWLLRNNSAMITAVQSVVPGYQLAQLQAIIAIISKFTAYEAKAPEFKAKIVERLEQLSEAIGTSDDLGMAFVEEDSGNLVAVFDALIKKFTATGADDLIDEDSL